MEKLVITCEIRERITAWTEYLRGISPLMLVKSILEEDFNLDLMLKGLKDFIHNGDTSVEFNNLDPTDICMYVVFNSAIKEGQKLYLVQDLLILCYNDKAVFAQYGFDLVEQERYHETCTYTASFYPWKERIDLYVKHHLEPFTQKVPSLKT